MQSSGFKLNAEYINPPRKKNFNPPIGLRSNHDRHWRKVADAGAALFNDGRTGEIEIQRQIGLGGQWDSCAGVTEIRPA
jgi:hypothetical protein